MQLQTDVAGERAVEGERRRTRRRQAALTALLLGVAGVGYRVVLLAAGVPPANSDEATMGLAALHISQGRELPVYFYGQHYMGTLEAYLAAPVVALAGPDIWALRLPLLLLYAVFLLAMWQLTRRLYTPWFATAIVGLLGFGSHRVIQNQFVAGGGYPEINPGAALLLLIAVVLGFRGAAARHAYGLYLAFGFIAGLLIWNDWLVAPYVAVAALLLLLPGARPLLGRPGLALLGGLLLGIAPLLWHDLTQPVGNGAIATFLNMSDGAAETGWAQRLHGGVLLGVPLAQGFCGYGRCEPWQIAWAPLWGLLLIAATVAAARGLWRRRAAAGPRLAQADPTLAQASPPMAQADPTLAQAGPERTAAQDRERTRQAGRLALLVAAAITVLMYVRDDAAAVTPWESARYLHGLLIATAAVCWPLWWAARRAVGRPVRVAGIAGLAFVAALGLTASGTVLMRRQEISAIDDGQRLLATELPRAGTTALYSDYWTCNLVTYLAGERVRCAVLDERLHPGYDRYAAYAPQVAAVPEQTFAFVTGSPGDAALAQWFAADGTPVEITTMGGYTLYRPLRPVPLPR